MPSSCTCMYSGMDLDQSYFSFSVYQFVNFLCFKCSTCAHYTQKTNDYIKSYEIARNDECEYF